MAQQKIQLRKIRDFGENLGDTFQFIRQEFKPLLTSFVLLSGIFILAASILGGLFQKEMFGVFDQLKTGGVARQQGVTSFFTVGYFGFIIVSLLSMAAMQTVIAAYMQFYDEHGESPNTQQVWAGFTKNFLKVFLYSIPQLIIIIISLFLCLFPVFYTITVLMPLTFIIVNENSSFGDSFGRCFDIIKQNFWISLAIYLVSYIIYSVSSGIIGIMVAAIVGAGAYFSTDELSSTAAIATSVLSVVQYVFYIIFFVSAGLHYYNLTELKDGTGLERRLEDLGGNNNPNTSIEEQY